MSCCNHGSKIDKVQEIFHEYGISLNEKKSSVVCVKGEQGNREWVMGTKVVKERGACKYLGVEVRGGRNGGIASMEERVKSAKKVWGMVKYGAKRSGNRFVVGREGWKSLVVSKLMYGERR